MQKYFLELLDLLWKCLPLNLSFLVVSIYTGMYSAYINHLCLGLED